MTTLTRAIDLVFCLVVLPVMVGLLPIERWLHHFTAYMLLAGVWLYVVYAVNRALTIPLLFGSRRRKLVGVGLMVGSVVVTLILSGIELYVPQPNIHDEGIVRRLPQIRPYQQALWALFMMVEAFSFAVGLLAQSHKQKSRLRAAEAERDKAEIELYKAQIKPHFMFNTLNALYGLFLTQSPHALPSLERFIAMMRYVHTSSGRDYVSLADETTYIRQYVAVQSLRLSDKTTVSLHIAIAHPELAIPPMLLISFVENCFTHGVSPDVSSTIHISLTETDGQLLLTTSNRIFAVRAPREHMGLKNSRRRLALLYPGSHRLTTESHDGLFTTTLSLHLKP